MMKIWLNDVALVTVVVVALTLLGTMLVGRVTGADVAGMWVAFTCCSLDQRSSLSPSVSSMEVPHGSVRTAVPMPSGFDR